ncbi:flagellar filament capping protein FliD [Bacillus sp. FJAT-42315]|uniref:flagellar filament capping protein FliD n=1 Tax=Bacillus sp. FJAT-42315 TaxID=2014077 RepID=UPI0012FF08B2|nr:flagellar filament capping protein FliD [Bacillus sp. FJAT-42315]
MRIGGLASGMDIDQLVKDLMKAERMPLDKMKQRRQKVEWQRDDYRSMYTQMYDFRAELTKLKYSNNYRARQVSSADESKVSATVASGANASSYSISNVEKLASAETIVNGGKVELNKTAGLYDQTSKLVDPSVDPSIDWKTGVIESKTITVGSAGKVFSLGQEISSTDASELVVKVDGKSYKVVTDSNDLTDNTVFVKSDGTLEFNKDLATNSTIKVDYIANTKTETLSLTKDSTSLQLQRNSLKDVTMKFGDKELIISSTGTERDIQMELENGDKITIGTLNADTGLITLKEGQSLEGGLEVTYNQNYTTFSVGAHTGEGQVSSETFFVQGNDSMDSVIKKVNASNVGASLMYDDFSKQMTLMRTDTGDFNKSGNEMFFSGALMEDVFKFNNSTITTAGQNAEFTINGLKTERSSNNFTMNGVTFTLKQTFTDEVKVNASNDSEKVFENIVSFVNKYNELIEKVQSKTTENVYRKYQPLTDEEREGLSEKQQELWDEKAKSGLLRRDPILTSALSEMRVDLSMAVKDDSVSSLYNSLAKIGITTTSNYMEGGKLTIDENKLKEAIEKDPAAVESLFISNGTGESQQGVIHRLYETTNNAMEKIRTKAGNKYSTNQQYSLGKNLDTMNKQIARFEDRLVQVEQRYWNQFTAMEKAIQRANEQSAYLMNAFA